MYDVSKSESWTLASSRWIDAIHDSYPEVGFNLNGFYYGIMPFCFEEACYLGYGGQTHQSYPFIPICDTWVVEKFA